MNLRKKTFCSAILIFIGIFVVSCISYDDVYVDANSVVPGDGSPDAPFQKISQALEVVAHSGTIHVASGDYYENLVVRHTMTLQGAGRENTNIYADINQKGIEIISDNVTVTAFSVIGSGEVTLEDQVPGGIWSNGYNNITIENNSVGPYIYCGICTGEGFNVNISNNEVSQISEYENDAGTGIVVAQVNGIVENNRSFDNGIGVYISGSSNGDISFDLTLTGNTIEENLGGGIYFSEAKNIVNFFDNIIVNNSGWGGLFVREYMSYLSCELLGSNDCELLLITDIINCGGNSLAGNSPNDFFDFWEGLDYCFSP